MQKTFLRIKNISKYIPPYKRIADVGCDHGYLIIDAFENYNIDFALAIDNKSGPLNRCINNLVEKTYYNNVRFSLSNGISDLSSDIDVVIMAGMGGLLACQIVEKNLEKLSNVKRIIVQANRNNYDVRKYFTRIGFDIKGESIVFEDNKYYEIICFDKVDYEVKEYSDVELQYGPINIKKHRKEFVEYLMHLLNRVSVIPFETEGIKNKKKQLKELINNENK